MLADRSRNVQALEKFKSFQRNHTDFFTVLNSMLGRNHQYFPNEGKFRLQVVEHVQSSRYTTKQLCKQYNLNQAQYNVMLSYNKEYKTLTNVVELPSKKHYYFFSGDITYIFSCKKDDIKHKTRENYMQMFERDTNLSMRVINGQVMGRKYLLISNNHVDKSGYNVSIKKQSLQEKLFFKNIPIQTQYNRLLKIQSIFQQISSKLFIIPKNLESTSTSTSSCLGWYSNLFYYIRSTCITMENVGASIKWNMSKQNHAYIIKRMKYAISKARSTARTIIDDTNWWNNTEEIKELAKQILEI